MKYPLIIALFALAVSACGSSYQATRDDEEIYNKTTAKAKIKDNDKILYNDFYEYLIGKVPGVIVRGKEIIIRGQNSINLSSAPLILVDGMEADPDDIDVHDIESVEVLKDGAASLYGFRAAGGVIKVRTKGHPKTRVKLDY